MGLKSPQTFGEFYWAKQVEASKFFADESEKAFAPYIADLLKDIPDIPEMPAGIQRMLDVLSEPPDFAFLPYLIGVGVNAVDEVLDIAFDPVLSILKRAQNRATREKWLTPAEVNILWSRKKITEGLWNETIASDGYEDILGSSLYEAELPYPTISDLVLYSRYHGDADNPWSEFQEWFNISPRDWPVWKWLGLQRLTTEQAHLLLRRGLLDESKYLDIMAKIGWSPTDRPLMQEIGWSIPNAMLLVQGDLLQQRPQDEIIKDISRADINPLYAEKYLDAILTKPASQDIIAYQLRREPELTGLATELQKIGIHPNYTALYRELAYVIPPVADIITMAVREAFTPEIAEKFGQYEDYPPDLETWGLKKGLSKEWSQRYWAAHWSLPSAGQGFDMLHRGLINMDELNMLLRALDVMPFWREKLTGIAYRRLSRVDIRRMYRVGVLNETEVLEAYSELGYNERDAKRMAEFTVKQVLATQSKFTSANIVTAYAKYMITRGEARSLLLDIGVRSENIDFILTSAEYKREWELTDSRISAIHNLYRKEVYTADKARAELLRLDLPAERVDVLMEQWYIDEKDKPPRYWTTAQTLAFIKAELILPARGKQELSNLGYDAEHIDIYMRSME